MQFLWDGRTLPCVVLKSPPALQDAAEAELTGTEFRNEMPWGRLHMHEVVLNNGEMGYKET